MSEFSSNRRFFSKQCEKNGEDNETCVELDEVTKFW